MTELEYFEIIRFVTQCFRDNADKDYINARFCYFSKLDSQCLWTSQQAIEKYLKSILLFNGISTKKLGHDLISSVKKLNSIKGIQFPFISSKLFHEFIEYLDTFGNNRYHEFTSQLKYDIIPNLDFVVWHIRKYCQRIREYNNGINNIAEFPIDVKQKNNVELNYDKYPNRFKISGGYIEKLIQSNTYSLARKYLVYKNPYFGKNRKKKLNYPFHSITFSTNLFSRPKLYYNLKDLVQFSKKTREYFNKLEEEKNAIS